ncbi:MAG: hypothetical protein FWD90_03710 [Defluviitaleaceae bacterium]|nr:hypothetical protein [Defluviitaleaceae bacterium]
MTVKQSNPTLFVLIGTAAELAPDLTRTLAGYRLQAAACVIVPDTNDRMHLRAEINRIQQDFLQHPYATVGLARIGYILRNASDFVSIRHEVEDIVSPLYPSGLITDIYWLADETSTLETDRHDRRASMEVLKDGISEAQVYLLSNLNSASRHTPWTDVLQTIALLTLFKDGEPREYAVPPDASRYSELRFLQNAGRGKPFLTAGSQRLQVPKKALRALLLTALLKPLPIPPVPAPQLNLPADPAGAKAPVWKPDEEFLSGIALPHETDKIIRDRMTRRTIISRLFGTRLDAITDMHPAAQDDPPPAGLADQSDFVRQLSGLGLFDALEATKENGYWPIFLSNMINNNAMAVSAAEKNLQTWLDTPQDIKELKTDRLRLSFAQQASNYPYTIAAEYLKRVAQIRSYRKYGEALAQAAAHVSEINAQLAEKRTAVENARALYEQDAQALTAADTPLSDTRDYFLNLFAEHARQNTQALRTLTMFFRDAPAPPEALPPEALEDYTDNRLLKDPIFSRSFTEMLTCVADDQAITKWAAQSKHTHIRLRSGSSALYHEANLHMPADWAARVKSGCEAQGLGRVNLFTDSAADRISVLYHAGAFAPGDLYYADLYL